MPNEDSTLIQAFCRFLESRLSVPGSMPMSHWMFYERTVERLVAAGELPRKAKEDFETANSTAFFRIMVNSPD